MAEPILEPSAAIASALQRAAAAAGPAEEPESDPAPRRGRPGASGPELNVVPLVDILFLLMVFFVIAGVFGLAEGILPSSMARGGTTPAGVPLPVSPIIVELNATAGQACELRVRPSQMETLRNPAELVAELQRIMNLPGFGPDTPVVIRSQDNVLWNDVASAWNAVVRSGFRDVVFGRPPPAASAGPS